MTKVIYLSTYEDETVIFERKISQTQYDLLKKDCDYIKSTYTQFAVYKCLQLNLHDFYTFVKSWSNIPANKTDFNLYSNINLTLKANRLVLNVLMNFKFFIDNAETYIKRKYGKTSTIANNFTILTSELFDNSFAYRFLSKLRNYSLHLGFPLEIITLDIDYNKVKPEESLHSFKFVIFKEQLLKEKELFGNIVYRELENLERELDLFLLIGELTHDIEKIQKFIYLNQKENIENSIINIDLFVGNLKTKTNQIKLYTKLDENELNYSIYHVPFDIIEEYKLTYENWR